MSWDYRVVRRQGNDRYEPTQFFYGIHEAYYKKTGECFAITKEPVDVFGDTPSEVLETLIMMRQACKRPVLDYETREPVEDAVQP